MVSKKSVSSLVPANHNDFRMHELRMDRSIPDANFSIRPPLVIYYWRMEMTTLRYLLADFSFMTRKVAKTACRAWM